MPASALPYLKNLSSSAVFYGNPWEFVPGFELDPLLRKDKALRNSWINNPSTEWSCWNTWEGLNENQRLGKKGRQTTGEEKDENPPLFCHGFVADYDQTMTVDEVASGFEAFKLFLPNYYCRSLSGNVHLLWLFEKPIRVGSFELAEEFLKVVGAAVHVERALGGFDQAFFTPGKYYTNGIHWHEGSPDKISHAVGEGWLAAAAAKINYSEKGYNVPLNIVHTELLKNPKFVAGWSDIEFAVGAQGPTWWVEGSQSPKSAKVLESGMFTFSSHATKEFYSWGELIGFSFVDQYRTQHVGEAVAGVYFDGRQFWREISRGDWKPYEKADLLHFLKVTRGLSARTEKGELHSEIDFAYEFLVDHHSIEGAAPFVFKPNGPITLNKKPFLNTHTARVTRPVDHKVEWGNPKHFPFLSQFFGPPSTIDPNPELPRFFRGGTLPLDTFLSWLSHYYRSAYDLNLRSGHNIFIAGPVGVGKTLLNRSVIGGLMNGFREAQAYLMGEDTFGAELFSVAHWVVDDSAMNTSMTAHRRWGEIIKRMAANKTFRYHEKFRTPMQVEWEGRVVSTLNNDEESARILPDLERALLDKIELYQTTDTPTIDFPEGTALLRTIDAELPYFARFLLQWETPEHCILYRRGESGAVDYRFGGIRPWHDAGLVQQANQSSRTSGFVEILSDWRIEYFRLVNENRASSERITTWTGSAFQLRKLLCISPATQDVLRSTDATDLGRTLAQLKSKGYPIESHTEDEDGIRYWTIHEGPQKKADKSALSK